MRADHGQTGRRERRAQENRQRDSPRIHRAQDSLAETARTRELPAAPARAAGPRLLHFLSYGELLHGARRCIRTALMDVRKRTWSRDAISAIDPNLADWLPAISASD